MMIIIRSKGLAYKEEGQSSRGAVRGTGRAVRTLACWSPLKPTAATGH